MASVINRGNGTTQTTSADCAPVCCPDCSGLECLCRPRFFAGQLLTDEDLKRLDYYITAKNKLHNRYLIGWGVVCGMNVVCNACEGLVTVKTGYALSPCGEDIVVCADTPVDVCSMIQKCSKKQPRDCQPTQPGGADPCSDTTEQWILSIHYDEKPSRGIVPLKNTRTACCSTCACGGSSSCGCGGKSSSCGCGCAANGSTNGCSCGTKPGAPATTQAQCEPTIVCETYHFEVCKVQPKSDQKPTIGALGERVLSCLTALQGLVSAPPASNDPLEVQNWCCAIRDNLLDFFADHPGYTCSIPQKLSTMCQSGVDVTTIKLQVGFMLAQYIKDCFCGSLLPPCPCPVEDASVPLATITVSKKDGACRIVSICNLDVRKFATTFPNLAYWLSIFPTVRDLRKAIAGFCCKPLTIRKVELGDQTHFVAFKSAVRKAAAVRMAAAESTVGTPFEQTHVLSEVTAQAFAQPDRIVDAHTLAWASLGLTDAENQPFLSDLELNHPLETLFSNQFTVPFTEAVLPASWSKILLRGLGGAISSFEGAQPKAAQPASSDELSALREKLSAMEEGLKNAQDQIDKLKKRK